MQGEDGDAGPSQLPPPMIPGNADVPTSLCAIQVRWLGWARSGVVNTRPELKHQPASFRLCTQPRSNRTGTIL